MTELKHKSIFERRYLGLGGQVESGVGPYAPKNEVVPQTYEELLAHYRKYVGDPEAELPKGIAVPKLESVVSESYLRALDSYRRYVGDPNAELPEEVLRELKVQGQV